MNRNQNNQIALFEALENRTMMSAAPVTHVEAAAKKPVVKVPAVHAAAVKTMAAAKLVNPAVTDKSITYKSFSNEPLYASTGPTINDINQGYIGDCYFLSTLSAVVKTDPTLIKKDIVADNDGTYTITFGGTKGTPEKVSTDLAVWPDGQVAYAQLGVQNCLWVSLMEKAFVQFSNPKADSYNSINGGWMSTAFTALGLKSQTITAEATVINLMTTLATDIKAGDFTTFGTVSTLPSNSPLIAGHAYEVESVNVTNSTVTLRNPWGEAAANDGYITVSSSQAFTAFAGVVVSHA